jgi:murein DD-endopeptidase MepM/ murein hydrolase activator NlpD
MPEKFSFLVLGDSGKIIKQTYCSNRVLYAVFSALILLLLVIGIGLVDYIRLFQKNYHKEILQAELTLQNQEVVHQRQQIQRFAREINQLKSRLVELNRMEQQIRRVADLEENSGVFGVGGSTPEDLDPDLALTRPHNQLIKEMHRHVDQLDDAVVHQQGSLDDLLKEIQERKNIMAYTPTIRPVEGVISSRFGYRQSPFTGKREFHSGMDIANRRGTEIVATANGRVSFVGEKRGLGRVVVIDHGHGLTTRYAHLEQALKKRGEPVLRGETIALMGNSGRSTGTHLHYEVRLNGVPVNPKKYFLD